jgi:hypothetical protein
MMGIWIVAGSWARRPVTLVLLGMMGIGGLAMGGCAAAPAAGEVAGATIGNTEAMVLRGKVEACERVTMEEAVATARKVAGELELRPTGEEKHPDQLKLEYCDERDQKIVVTLVRRTPRVTELHVDVGFFGAWPMGRLVMWQILHDLPGQREATTQATVGGVGK